MKDVCRETGLTDKAVRFYIQNGLISPQYTENYNGRKNFDFSENDVALLIKIATLRKYNFSVSDIKTLLAGESTIGDILDSQLRMVTDSVAESSFVLTNLKNAAEQAPENVDTLCDILQENLDPDEFSMEEQLRHLWYKGKKKLPLMLAAVIGGLLLAAGIIAAVTLALSELFSNLV